MEGKIESKIPIEWNEGLFEFINFIKGMINMEEFNNINFDKLQLLQHKLRKIFIKCQSLLTISKHPFKLEDNKYSYPSFFGLFCLLISDLSRVHKWEDVLGNNFTITIHSVYDIVAKKEDMFWNEKECYCCCGHWVMDDNQYLITNKDTGYNILVGSVCKTKYNLLSPQDNKYLNKLKLGNKKKYIKYMTEKMFNEWKEKTKLIKEYKKKIKLQKDICLKLICIRQKIKLRILERRLRKGIKYMYNILLNEKVELKKVKDNFGSISYYKLFKISTKNYSWVKYINFCISPQSTTNYNTQLKLNKYKKFNLKKNKISLKYKK
jgi:hypothetical protein